MDIWIFSGTTQIIASVLFINNQLLLWHWIENHSNPTSFVFSVSVVWGWNNEQYSVPWHFRCSCVLERSEVVLLCRSEKLFSYCFLLTDPIHNQPDKFEEYRE